VVLHFRVLTVGTRMTAARPGGTGRTGEKRDAAMGAMRKAGVWLGLIEDEDDRHYDGHGYDDDFDEDVEEAPVPVRPRAAAAERLAEAREAGRGERTSVRALSRSTGTATATTYPTRDNLALAPQVQLRERAVVAEEEELRYQITTLHPTTYNEARTIGEHFRDGVPVIMNLTEMAEADAKRLVDFAAGLAFGLRGTMERVTNRVFLLSPANVQVTAEDKARIAEGGFFNQS
jgi:cell division inhibitor SepF